MNIIADLHVHSKHSQATSKNLDLINLEKYGKIKGIDLIGTGDFTHPKWIKELKENLTEQDGIFKTKSGFNFMLQTEISFIYSQDGKGRRIHLITLAPNFDVVDQITEFLLTKGRIDYDGRPIFGMSCPEYVETLKSISKDIEIIPAHIWTPWFSVFGSKSGFDRMEDCFHDQTKHIHAIETGLSSDPAMNWRISGLDKYNLVSFSDLHSYWPWRLGREATVFDVNDLTYQNVINSIRTGEGLKETLEFWPEEGKYHFDGHRKCNTCLDPKEANKHNKICPVCKKPLTIGVANRIEELADRDEGFKPSNAKPFKNLIPLSECIAGHVQQAVATKKVWGIYNELLKAFPNEIDIMLNVSKEELVKVVDEKLADIIIKNRNQEIIVKPGYDGVYGEPQFKRETPTKAPVLEEHPQKSLGGF
jgi:uncharacterized protein (TIGR00375 family)